VVQQRQVSVAAVIMAALRSRCGHYILAMWFLLSIFFPSPNLSGRRLAVYHTSTHGANLESSSSSCGLSTGRCRPDELAPCLSILFSAIGGYETDVEWRKVRLDGPKPGLTRSACSTVPIP